MTNKERILKKCFEDVIWMAIRYARCEKDLIQIENSIKIFSYIYNGIELRSDIVVINDESHILKNSIIWHI